MFKNVEDIKTYVEAGRAVVTLTSKRTGKWFTYKVTRAKDRETGELTNSWFVALLTGPDNWANYSYIGMLDAATGLRLTKGSKASDDAPAVRGWRYFWRHIEAGVLPADIEVRHEGSCGRCGRTLTVPESIDRGIGPECWGKMGL